MGGEREVDADLGIDTVGQPAPEGVEQGVGAAVQLEEVQWFKEERES